MTAAVDWIWNEAVRLDTLVDNAGVAPPMVPLHEAESKCLYSR